jgi:hypothetical protein
MSLVAGSSADSRRKCEGAVECGPVPARRNSDLRPPLSLPRPSGDAGGVCKYAVLGDTLYSSPGSSSSSITSSSLSKARGRSSFRRAMRGGSWQRAGSCSKGVVALWLSPPTVLATPLAANRDESWGCWFRSFSRAGAACVTMATVTMAEMTSPCHVHQCHCQNRRHVAMDESTSPCHTRVSADIGCTRSVSSAWNRAPSGARGGHCAVFDFLVSFRS